MQFIAKDLLTLELDGTPYDSAPTPVADRALMATELAAESLRAGGRLRLRVRGESMLPTLWPGDVVEIASCSVDDVAVGEIVLAVRDGRFFLHRFLHRSVFRRSVLRRSVIHGLGARSSADGFHLRGDSMPEADPEFSNGALIGRLASSPRGALLWRRMIGRLLCYCGPMRRLALRVHARSRRQGDLPVDSIAPGYTISELPRAGA